MVTKQQKSDAQKTAFAKSLARGAWIVIITIVGTWQTNPAARWSVIAAGVITALAQRFLDPTDKAFGVDK